MPCERIAQQMGGMFTCAPHDNFTRIRTPFLYPDGDVIDLFVHHQGSELALTDLGESMRWLRTQTVAMKKSPKQRTMINDVCATLGVELVRGMIVLKLPSEGNLAEGVVRLAQAAIRIADIYFTMRTRSFQSVNDEVDEFLHDRSIPFERAVSVTGGSGKEWNVDFVVKSGNQRSLVQILSTGSRAAARGIVEHVFTAFTDIKSANDRGVRTRISVFDDSRDIWEPGDYKLVQDASDAIALWSKPEELASLLRQAS